MISAIMVLCLLFGTVIQAKAKDGAENNFYEEMLEAYLDGRSMEEWAVKARRQIADELGLSEYLDEKSFLSVDYRNENNIGRDGAITDPKLNLLVEMATTEEEERILTNDKLIDVSHSNSKIQTRSIAVSHGAVNVTQMARVSGAGNGYFTISNGGGSADSYGYCAQNSKSYWGNGGTKVGAIVEWDNAEARKALYYGPGGPGYAGPYYGSLGADMDYVTFTVGQLNGDTRNNTKANAYRSFLSSRTDPISSGYRAYKADIAEPYQDVAFLSYSPVTKSLTITKRSQTDLYSGDGEKYLTGATFGLYAWNGSSYATKIATATDNGNGTYTFSNISRGSSVDGWFLVKEEAAKAGYTTDYLKFDNTDASDYNTYGGRQFLLDGNLNWSCYSMRNHQYPDWGYTFLDYPNNVTVTITKKDKETGEKLTGAEFELWAYRGGNAESASGVPGYSYKVGNFTDNGDGTYSATFPFDLATFNGSHYWFMYKETKAPEGHIKDSWAAGGYGFCFDANGNGTKEFVVENAPYPRIQIQKSSADPSLTDGNDCYSLTGAEYTIYSDAACTQVVDTLVTDENGSTSPVTVDPGTYWIKEIVAPKGFALDPQTYTVTVQEGVETLNVKDLPQLDPIGILLGKVNKETNSNRPTNSLPLQGAWYEIKYYGVLLDDSEADPEVLGYEPLRTWVFETDEDGFCEYNKQYLVSGDELFMSSSGEPSLPIGTITIQEIKAPEGYLINETVYVRQVTSEGIDEDVNTYNYPILPEATFNLNVLKLQAGTKIGVPGTAFEHTMPNGQKEVLTTDENGTLSFKALNYGDHELREISNPEGYILNRNIIKFTIATDNTVTFTSENDNTVVLDVSNDGNVEVTVYEDIYPFSFIIHKQNNKGNALEGAEFTLYADAACTQVVQTGITGADGILRFSNLKTETKYYLKETKAPAGYRIPVDESGNPIITEIYVYSVPAQNIFDLYVNGEKYDLSSEGAFSISGTKEDQEVHITVVNDIGTKLPNTGSSITLILMLAGVLLFTWGFSYISMKREKKNPK